MDGENGKRIAVYNTKRDSRKKGDEKKEKEKKRAKGGRKTTVKRKSSVLLIKPLGAYPKMLFVWMHE